MTMPQPAENGNARVVIILGSVVTAGFLAWAGVVFDASQSVQDLLWDVAADVREVRVTVETIADRLERHEARPWHDAAGDAIAAQRRESDVQRQRINHLEEEHDGG